MVTKEWLKGKSFMSRAALEPLVLPVIVILVGLSAFALGRLSAIAGQSGQPASNAYEKAP